MKHVVIGVVLGVVIVIGAIFGLHFANIIRLPFLPTSSEIALALSLDRVTKDGSFDIDAEAAIDVSIAAGDDEVDLKAESRVKGSVRDFERSDPYSFKIADGEFASSMEAVSATGAEPLSFLEVEGSFEADLTREIVKYVLREPFAYAGSLRVDVEELKNAPKSEFEIKDLRVDGGTAKLTISGKSIEKSKAFQDALENLAAAGYTVNASLDDVGVTLTVDEQNDRISVTIDASLDLTTENELLDNAVISAFSLVNALAEIADAGKCDIALEGTVSCSLEVPVFGRPVAVSFTLGLEASCVASGLSAGDLSEIMIADGSFSTELKGASLIQRYLPDLGFAGTFEVDFGDGELRYALTKPNKTSESLLFDVDALVFSQRLLSKSDDDVDVTELVVRDGTITFTITGESLMQGKAFEQVFAELEKSLGSDSIELDDIDVAITADGGTGRTVVQMNCSCFIKGLGSAGLPDAKLNADIDADLTLSPAA